MKKNHFPQSLSHSKIAFATKKIESDLYKSMLIFLMFLLHCIPYRHRIWSWVSFPGLTKRNLLVIIQVKEWFHRLSKGVEYPEKRNEVNVDFRKPEKIHCECIIAFQRAVSKEAYCLFYHENFCRKIGVWSVLLKKKLIKHRSYSVTDEICYCFQKILKFDWWKKKELWKQNVASRSLLGKGILYYWSWNKMLTSEVNWSIKEIFIAKFSLGICVEFTTGFWGKPHTDPWPSYENT